MRNHETTDNQTDEMPTQPVDTGDGSLKHDQTLDAFAVMLAKLAVDRAEAAAEDGDETLPRPPLAALSHGQ